MAAIFLAVVTANDTLFISHISGNYDINIEEIYIKITKKDISHEISGLSI